jgi:ketosteroid isomerase-like protein
MTGRREDGKARDGVGVEFCVFSGGGSGGRQALHRRPKGCEMIKFGIAAIAVMIACGSAQAKELSQVDIVTRHMTAVNNKDIEGAVADYSDDAVMILPGKVVEGKAALRALFLAGFARVPANEGLGMEIERIWLEGKDIVSAPWHKGKTLNGIDKFLLRDGKIVAQAVFLSGEPPMPTNPAGGQETSLPKN